MTKGMKWKTKARETPGAKELFNGYRRVRESACQCWFTITSSITDLSRSRPISVELNHRLTVKVRNISRLNVVILGCLETILVTT